MQRGGIGLICQRCGGCCVNLDVAIVNPRCILPDGTLTDEDKEQFLLKPAGFPCPHLSFAEGLAVCAIHHIPCYKGSPCDQFDQPGPSDSICVLKGYYSMLGSRP